MASNFITNLKNDIEKTAIYRPTGKYGRNELDSWETRNKKNEKLLNAQPSTAEEINDYLLYVYSLNCVDYVCVYRKLETLLEYSKYPENQISPALKIYNKVKDRLKLLTKINYLIWVLLAISIIWATVHEFLISTPDTAYGDAVTVLIGGSVIFSPIAYVAHIIVKQKLGLKDENPF